MGIMSSAYNSALDGTDMRFDPHQKATLPAFDRLVDALNSMQKSPSWFLRGRKTRLSGIYLWGSVGRGKSLLMDLFFTLAPVRAKKRIHFHAFMHDIHAQIHKIRQKGVDDAIIPVADKIAKKTTLLCLDEMQITDIADAMIIGRLFERLLEKQVVVVTTTNDAPDKLYENGLNRALFLPFIDMLKARFEIVKLEGENDYRKEQLACATRYFHPLSRETAREIDKIWEDLCAGHDETARRFALKGRTLCLERFCNNGARIDFDTLCNQPLSAEDYLVFCREIEVLIVENIPILSPQNMDAARRFITLIDVLYDSGVIAVFSADAPPEALYPKGRGAAAFERTVSRIYEMRAPNWGTRSPQNPADRT